MNILFFITTMCVSTTIQARLRYSSNCPLPTIESGLAKFIKGRQLVRIQCKRGYTVAGDRFSICTNGHWDKLPKCVAGTCKPVKRPAHSITYPAYGNGALNFYCDYGYTLKGASITYCNGTTWDAPLPTCFATNTTIPLKCDFEAEDICGWNHDINHDFDWTRHSWNTPSRLQSVETGPANDHTPQLHGAGHYMYIESSGRNENETARLISPVYEASPTNTCFEFFYHMYGKSMGTLRAYVKLANQTWDLSPARAFFNQSGNQGNRWIRSFTTLGPISEEFQIIIEALSGRSYTSDIAIDDVRIIHDCQPDFTTTEETMTSSESPLIIESCQNRCDSRDDPGNSTHLINCDCDYNCFTRFTCCPDMLEYCWNAETLTPEAEVPTSTSTVVPTTTPDTDIGYIKREYSEENTVAWVDDVITERILIGQAAITEIGRRQSFPLAVFIVGGVAIALMGVAYLAYRTGLFRLKRFGSGAFGDSQSEVRFFAKDDNLDMDLPENYTDL